MRILRTSLIILMTFFVGVISINTSVHATEADKLIIHYHRFDDDYGSWGLWLWANQPTPGDGLYKLFDQTDDFGEYYEIDLAGSYLEGSTRIGFIVRDGSWTKDIAADRFIDMTSPDVNGDVHVYLVSGDATIYSDASAVDTSARAMNVGFTSLDNVNFTLTDMVTQSDVTVFENGVSIPFSDFTMNTLSGTLSIDGGVDLSKSYTIEFDFNEAGYEPKNYPISLSGIYSSDEFNDNFAYDGDLGALYTTESTTFRLWAPISDSITLNLYDVGHNSYDTDYDGITGTDVPYMMYDLIKIEKGVWEITVVGDLHGVYYTYDVTNSGITNEVVDPYAFSTGVNGYRGMVVDFERLNPDSWVSDYRPNIMTDYNDAIIYEAQIRDYTTHDTWNGTEAYRGTFLGFAESGTSYNGVTTGFDHIVELGITHVQLLPVFDFGAAVDETRLTDSSYISKKDTIFNWGYMPENFNSIEGSFSTNPYDGSVRITEFKTLIQAFHNENIRIIMDVVYNHTGKSSDSNFDLILPGYYFRMTEAGSFSNGSGTGNETASENYMMSKFMVDSTVFYAEEYNISGFRFDLMKLHDYETMNKITDALHAIDPTIMVYGEPWTGGTSLLPDSEAAFFDNMAQMPSVAVFNDDLRNSIKGSVWNDTDLGFIQGLSTDEVLKIGIVGSVYHNDLNVPDDSRGAFAVNPNQSINYVTAHDNNTLYDKIMLSTEDLEYEDVVNMQKQANAIILTSQGIPFIHGGVEIMRSKPCIIINGEAQGECDATLTYDHNSYRSPDETNQIDWSLKTANIDVFEYYKGLIELRKSTDVFSYNDTETIQSNIYFNIDGGGIVSYVIYDPQSVWEYTLVVHNNSTAQRFIDLQGKTWNLVANQSTAGTSTIEVLSTANYPVLPNETLVMYVLKSGETYPLT
ncbi:MAG: type I pullulanase, partial [Candidatus Izemoplasma sp.]